MLSIVLSPFAAPHRQYSCQPQAPRGERGRFGCVLIGQDIEVLVGAGTVGPVGEKPN